MTAMADLAHLDPIGARATDPPFEDPTSVAEALELLRTAKTQVGQYPDELVDVLLDLIDDAAEQVAAAERARWAVWFDRMGRTGTALAQSHRGGLHLAAHHLRHDLARYRPGDLTE